jgi:enoyl-CoA hydratase/carnithine racemase
MPYEAILYEVREHTAHLTLNRPNRLNAMNAVMLDEFAEAVEAFERDDEAWVLIVSGAGRSFCSGRDVQMFQDQMNESADARKPSRTVGPPFLSAIESGKPVIGAVQGHVFGLGIMMAGECSMLVAAEDAQFGMTEVKRSMSGAGAWAHVTQWIPSKLAVEMAVTGEPLPATDAFRLGLVNRLVPNANLMEEAEALAARVLAVPPLAARATMKGIRAAVDESVSQRLALIPTPPLNDTEDYRESVESFLEKRPPNYRGR